MLKTVILIGGPSKGTRFRPLSLDIPKPLFPVAGFPMIHHHVEAASQVPGMKEIILIGGYQPSDQLNRFITDVQHQYKILVRYLQEYAALGTGGGMFHFRDQILSGNPRLFFVMNADVCGDFPLKEMLAFHSSKGNEPHYTILGTEATRQQSLTYGCIVHDNEQSVLHYVEKPETFISSTINCGIYLFDAEIFQHMKTAFRKNQADVRDPAIKCTGFEWDTNVSAKDMIRLEQDVIAHQLAGSGKLFVYQTTKFWSQIKSAGAAIYANRHYLEIYRRTHPDYLAQNGDNKPRVIGDVFIHPSAVVHPSATLGPNVTIGRNVTVGAGVRVRESMVLQGALLQDHCCVLHSVIGWESIVGEYTRIEGTPNDPNPNKPFTKLEIPPLFSDEGKLNPSITVIGSNVQVPGEIVILNSVVLPNKELGSSFKNQIIL